MRHAAKHCKPRSSSYRGEIATRILSTARELDLETYSIYTGDDIGHTYSSDHAIKLSSPAAYLNIEELINIARKHDVDAVHPGYGFLSESAEFAERMWKDAGILVIGPGPQILSRTGDKLQAKLLAAECNVPVLPALPEATNDITSIKDFASNVGYPVMIKAVDGGGGRGIRLVMTEDALSSAAKRAIEESPSHQVFAEKAALSGYRHIEVQIVGDGKGSVRHLWERECSIQRRYQKVVEMAPSSVRDRGLVKKVINAAIRMAEKVSNIKLS